MLRFVSCCTVSYIILRNARELNSQFVVGRVAHQAPRLRKVVYENESQAAILRPVVIGGAWKGFRTGRAGWPRVLEDVLTLTTDDRARISAHKVGSNNSVDPRIALES